MAIRMISSGAMVTAPVSFHVGSDGNSKAESAPEISGYGTLAGVSDNGYRLGIWAQHALQWHFLAMWFLMLNGLAYLVYGLISGRFRRLLIPLRPREVLHETFEALKFRLGHADLTRYNAVQKINRRQLLRGALSLGAVSMLTGCNVSDRDSVHRSHQHLSGRILGGSRFQLVQWPVMALT
jgi:hypothetical protein